MRQTAERLTAAISPYSVVDTRRHLELVLAELARIRRESRPRPEEVDDDGDD